MKVLWLSNIMLPVVAEHLGMEATNKEGWLAGLSNVIMERQQSDGVNLAIAFPIAKHMDGYHEIIRVGTGKIECFGFYEDVSRPECYNEELEVRMNRIVREYQPDVIHCFGTEYPHTLAMCKAAPDKERILISIQGLCSVYANTYYANLPQKIVNSITLRDILKQDSLVEQYEKFVKRGINEIEAVRLAGNISGRTSWDRHYAKEWNPKAKYHHMNETLRSNFYQGAWESDKCIPHSIFLSQGDYPIKGLHYMLHALPKIKKKYPDVKVYVAGNSIVKTAWKDKWKASAYGKYIAKIIENNHLENNIEFLGRLNAEQMKERYLKSNLFVCCSTIENSPNSLGEAMILGVPCVSADVGGIESIFEGGKDGILYRGYRSTKNSFDGISDVKQGEQEDVQENAHRLADAVLEMWSDEEKMLSYCRNAKKHAEITHNGEENYRKLMQIYGEIASNGGA